MYVIKAYNKQKHRVIHFSFTNSVSECKSKSWQRTEYVFGETVFAEGGIYRLLLTIKIDSSCHIHLSWILLKYFLQVHLLSSLRRFILLHKKRWTSTFILVGNVSTQTRRVARVQRHMLLLPLGQLKFPVSLGCK